MKESEFCYKNHRSSYTVLNEVYFRIQWSVRTPTMEAEREFWYKNHRSSYTELNEVYFRMQWSVGTSNTEANDSEKY